MKDLFSTHADQYAQYRPTYPLEVFTFLNTLLPVRELAWDCGTGNGQVASILANHFSGVYATDISQSQLNQAQPANNILYSLQPAEKTNFDAHIFDLIIIAQAIHWFDFGQFYAEVRRTAKQGALLAVLGYGRFSVSPRIDEVIDEFYHHVIGKYWEKERKHIDSEYQNIPFPFQEIYTPKFTYQIQWSLEHLIGYIDTWSAVKRFVKENSHNPLDNIHSTLQKLWTGTPKMTITFPILFRLGRVL